MLQKAFESASKPILKEVAQEGRKYGVFLILATQRITLLDDTITAQLNTKFILRTVRESDIMTIKEETDISSDDAKRLPYLTTAMPLYPKPPSVEPYSQDFVLLTPRP